MDAVPDTIVALATPPGQSALAVLRLAGPEAFEILRSLTGLKALPEARHATLLLLRDPAADRLLDSALVTVFPGPDSYTGGDLAEISCHGGFQVPMRVLEACVALGARAAEPGEFTRRAYLAGKLDLIQAEAVNDLIHGRCPVGHDVAIHQLERGLSRRIAALREELVQIQAHLVHHIDFPEEDDAPTPIAQITAEATVLVGSLRDLLRTAPEGELLREGAVCVLAGRPNSGKSSLFNALIGRERAIVTTTPGTTRDALEAVVALAGLPFRLVDTAGLREATEEVEQIGIDVARRYLAGADVVVLCRDSVSPLDAEEVEFIAGMGTTPLVVVGTKLDLREGPSEMDGALTVGGRRVQVVETSTVSGAGLDVLRDALAGMVFSGLVQADTDAPVITQARQAQEIRNAVGHIEAFVSEAEGGVPAELAASHLLPAETALEEVVGVIPDEEVLDRVFRDFCIGK